MMTITLNTIETNTKCTEKYDKYRLKSKEKYDKTTYFLLRKYDKIVVIFIMKENKILFRKAEAEIVDFLSSNDKKALLITGAR